MTILQTFSKNSTVFVQKKNGDKQKFDYDKIKSSLEKVFDRTESLSRLDDEFLKSLLGSLFGYYVGQNTLPASRIREVVADFLSSNGFHFQAESYNEWDSLTADCDTDALTDYVFYSKYSRYLPEEKRRETFSESVDRVRRMHLKRYGHISKKLEDLIHESFSYVDRGYVLPSMRSMQFGGLAQEVKHERGYNCSYSPCNRVEFFHKIFFLLLCGCGVGYSVQRHHVARLPKMGSVDISDIREHVVEDTIEGWSHALRELILSVINGYFLIFHYHKIRPKGSPILTGGGKAPGSKPLEDAIEKIRGILYRAQGRNLTPLECHDIICIASDAVLAGGQRRSALICLFSHDDKEMINCKTGDWWKEENQPWRARANNSAVLVRGEVTFEQFSEFFQAIKQWGEPGFYFTEDKEYGTNPCVSGDTLVLTAEGEVRVKDLIGKPFTAIVEGERMASSGAGFFYTGEKEVFKISAKEEGSNDVLSVKVTANHKFMTSNGLWVEADLLSPGIGLKINDHQDRNAKVVSVESVGVERVYDCTIPGVHAFGANGFYVHNCAEIGFNPHIEITPERQTYLHSRGEFQYEVGDIATGISFCNLTENNVAKCKTKQEFYDSVRASSIIGTLQAGYTDFPFLGPVTELIVRREALLGVSLTGMMDNPDIAFDPEVLREGARIAVEANKEISKMIGINTAARVTCVKPAGSTSIIFGSVGSGIHPQHAKTYFRRARANPLDNVYKHFKAANPHMCKSLSPTKDVITFCVKASERAITKDKIDALEMLDKVRIVQNNWVVPGTVREENSPGLKHNVSNTIHVKSNEWEGVRDYIWDHKDQFTGIALLSVFGDKMYEDAPFEAVVNYDDVVKWNKYVEDYKPVDYSGMVEEEDNTNLQGEIACSGGNCDII